MARRIKPVREEVEGIIIVRNCGAGDITSVHKPKLSKARTKEVIRKSLPAAVDKFRAIPKGKVLVLDRLREDFGFDPLKEMVDMFKSQKEVIESLKKDFEDDALTQPKQRLYTDMSTANRQIVEEIQRYCYPHMKNADGHGQGKGSVTFNINTGTHQTSGLKDVSAGADEKTTIDVDLG